MIHYERKLNLFLQFTNLLHPKCYILPPTNANRQDFNAETQRIRFGIRQILKFSSTRLKKNPYRA